MKFRRRHLLSGFLGLLSGAEAVVRGQAASASSSNTIEVGTVEEFFKAIGSNRTLRLTAPRYNLSELSPELKWTNAAMTQTTDGYELIISGVENLKIESLDNERSLLVTEPRYADVLTFEKCRNITISHIEAGHWPKKGTCTGSVVTFANCDNVLIDDSVLFGSGAYGVMAYNAQNISITSSVIKECTYGIIFLNNVRTFTAQNCRFYNNEGLGSFIEISNSSELIQFIKCEFNDNKIRSSYKTNTEIFQIENSEPILVENCLIRNNTVASLTNKPNLVRLIGNQLENNDFQPAAGQ